MFTYGLPPVEPNECKWRCGKFYQAPSNWLYVHEQSKCPLRPRKRPRGDHSEEARRQRPFLPDKHPGPQPESSCIFDDQPEDIPMSSLANRRSDNAAEAGTPLRLQKPDPWIKHREQPFDLFSGEHDYKLARWFVKSKTPKGQIDDFFNDGLH
ncbi:hypothetical protein EDC01DRAFT_784554 [Geopyxis carbonaria]|nr:hypothetical protein EDC01DRAFT_784554 [Geopyxis carbonaria]